jgi:hypothetical protein
MAINSRLVFLLLVCATAVGCSLKRYGLHRSAEPAPVIVGFECIEKRVGAITGVEDLDYSTTEGGRPLTWSGIKPSSTEHRFSFTFDGEEMDMYFEEFWDGRISYSGSASSIDKGRAARLIELGEPLFAEIERNLQVCGFDDLGQRVHSTRY